MFAHFFQNLFACVRTAEALLQLRAAIIGTEQCLLRRQTRAGTWLQRWHRQQRAPVCAVVVRLQLWPPLGVAQCGVLSLPNRVRTTAAAMIGARACVRAAAACARCRVVPSTAALLRRATPGAALRSHIARQHALRSVPVWGVRGFASDTESGSGSDSAGSEEPEVPVVTEEAAADDAAAAAGPTDMTVLKPREVRGALCWPALGVQYAVHAPSRDRDAPWGRACCFAVARGCARCT